MNENSPAATLEIATAHTVLDGYVSRTELAGQLHLKPRTISEWIARPDGLPYVKLGKCYFFKVIDVRAWIEARSQNRNRTHKQRKENAARV